MTLHRPTTERGHCCIHSLAVHEVTSERTSWHVFSGAEETGPKGLALTCVHRVNKIMNKVYPCFDVHVMYLVFPSYMSE
jgi:hypothetical protein